VSSRSGRRASVASLLALPLLLAACGGDEGGGAASPDIPDDAEAGAETALKGQLRLGLFPNVTHAPGIVNVEEGHLEDALGDEVDLTIQSFNAGPDVIEALLSGALDASYIGPNPAINGFAQSNGEALRIVAGTTSGGAFLVTRPDITSVGDLAGTTISTPQLGNTQDVALRAWLLEEGYETTLEGGGDVAIQPQANAQILETFLQGTIDGAWVPEPWATRMIEEGGGEVLVDERELWDDGEFVTTHLIVRTDFLEERPDLVRALLLGHLEAIDATNADPEAAQETVAAYIDGITGSPVSPEILDLAWPNMTFTWDPIADSLRGSAEDATNAGLLDPVDLEGIYDLDLLNELLGERGESEVSS
jgi:NitT/TauT family transport system substrate-binding protein